MVTDDQFDLGFRDVVDGDILIFNELVYDESNGYYTPNDGVFTSPLDGFYQFELNLVSVTETYIIEVLLNDAIGLCSKSVN